MSVVGVKQTGDFKKTKNFLDIAGNISKLRRKTIIDTIAKEGARSLSSNTPVDTGKTASMWNYEITEKNGKIIVDWTNDNIVKGINIAVIIQYGHATKNGGYVQGRDYINPALRPIFDQMAENMWKAVVSL